MQDALPACVVGLEIPLLQTSNDGQHVTAMKTTDPDQSAVKKLMREFDELPQSVRTALASAHQPSDQMVDVLCNMHRNGFPEAALLKVIAANNAKGERP